MDFFAASPASRKETDAGAPPSAVSGPLSSRHSRLFLAVFGVFVALSTVSLVGMSVVVLSGRAAASHDFISYWATSRQLLHRQNPYASQAVLSVEHSAGFQPGTHVLMMRNPPTALFLVLPLGFLPAGPASVLWTLLLAGGLILSVETLRGLRADLPPNFYLLGYCFAPAIANLATGQTGVFSLLGLALFLRFINSRPLLAGASLSLCAIKPHLLLPFAAVLLAWIVTRKAFPIVWGFLLAVVAEFSVSLCLDHSVWSHYCAMMRADGIGTEFVPTLGTLLRFSVHRQALWLQFLPAMLASGWALYFFYRRKHNWNWLQRAPLLILVSLAVAPYAWFSDQSIALVAILLCVRPERALVPLMVFMSAASLEMLCALSFHSQVYLWQGLAWLGWYLYAAQRSPASGNTPRKSSQNCPVPAEA